MKCKYRFKVNGRIRLSTRIPIPVSSGIFDCELKNGLISHIIVTVPITQRDHWPSIHKETSSVAKATVRISTPHLFFITHTLRSLQGLLSLFGGLNSINLLTPEVEWLPENEQEESELKLYSYKSEMRRLPDEEIKPFPFDLFARSVMAADATADTEVVLNFFRHGKLDMYNHEYIEAIYDFYFVIETLFAEGKFRRAAVSKAFQGSEKLRSFIKEAMKTLPLEIMHLKGLRAEFDKTYREKNIDEVIEYVFDLRGRLHHHSLKRTHNWHPDKPECFELDARFLQAVAHKACLEIAKESLYDNSIIQQYNDLVKSIDFTSQED